MKTTAVKSAIIDVDWSAQTVLPIEFKGRELNLEARAYQGSEPQDQALVLINRGTNGHSAVTPLVRVHSGCVTGDIFHSLRCDCYKQLQAALEDIVDVPNGILIYLPAHEGRGIGLVNKIRAYALQDKGLDTVDANVEIGAPIDARDYTLSADILRDLGFTEIRLLTNNPAKINALEKQGIQVVEQVAVITEPSPHNQRYLDTKRERMAHKL